MSNPSTTWRHDPQEVLDYYFDFATNVLEAGETVSTKTVVAADTDIVTIGTDAEAPWEAPDGQINFWVTAAAIGSTQITCTITTSAGRTYQETRTMIVQEG